LKWQKQGKQMKIHLEWGAEALKIPADAMVIVDCLSFTTGVSVACARGAKIYPYLFRQSAQSFADKLGVQCAGKRKQGGVSLSPASLQNLQSGAELVLPSPNGSTLTLSAKAETVLAGSLRNAVSIANYLRVSQFDRVVFVAAGERWISDGSLRPAHEDLIACGAIISLLEGTKAPDA
jgi:2-phosphosulfolactate phosphatase